jgi:hypothetical protein
MSFFLPRTVTLTTTIIQALNSLAESTSIDNLDLETTRNNLRSAQNLAININNLDDHDHEIDEVRTQLEAQELALRDAQQQNRQHLDTIRVLTATAAINNQ